MEFYQRFNILSVKALINVRAKWCQNITNRKFVSNLDKKIILFFISFSNYYQRIFDQYLKFGITARDSSVSILPTDFLSVMDD